MPSGCCPEQGRIGGGSATGSESAIAVDCELALSFRWRIHRAVCISNDGETGGPYVHVRARKLVPYVVPVHRQLRGTEHLEAGVHRRQVHVGRLLREAGDGVYDAGSAAQDVPPHSIGAGLRPEHCVRHRTV
uniref:Uncharacterized protein n=1 Tax=Anopheles atroparvus TaxID=41427 RepID=A0AAG5DLK3_ANOAO